VFPAETSQSALPSPLAKLADIPEEEIWLAKTEKQTHALRLQARCAGQGQGHRCRRRRRNKGGQAKPIRRSFAQ
jgi:hypothetical protein